MPRLPVDGDKVREIRVTLGTKERQIADSLATSARISSLDVDRIIQTLYDPLKIIEIAYSIATIIEILGIETGLPTPVDLVQYLDERKEKGENFVENSRIENAIDALTGEFNLSNFLTAFASGLRGGDD